MSNTDKIIRIAQRINRAKVALDLALTNRDLFVANEATDLRPHARRIGLRRARLSMLAEAMRRECATLNAAA
jgi:hypothetical protein